MSEDENKPGGLTDEQKKHVRRALYGDTPPVRPKPKAPRPSFDQLGADTVVQWRVGVCTVVLGCYILLMFLALPHDNNRWLFLGFSLLTVAAGGWMVDRANKRLRSLRG